MINRIIDANLNRIIESLRLIEDIVRFYLDKKTETLMIKNFRHEIINHFKSYNLLTFRNIQKDKGKNLNTKDEFKRKNINEVIQSNCKRVQESSRVLEEILKVNDKKASGLFKKIRFFIYHLEKEIILAIKKDFNLNLYAIIDIDLINIKEVTGLVQNVINGGPTMVQLKADNLDNGSFTRISKKIKKILSHSNSNIPLIINNRIDIAILSEADGIHIKDKYINPNVVRKKFYYDKIIGLSAANNKDLEQALFYKADYAGIEPQLFIDIKKKTIKLNLLKQVYKKYSKKLPVVIMEGLSPNNIALCLKEGIKNFAMTSAILRPETAKLITSQFKKMITEQEEKK